MVGIYTCHRMSSRLQSAKARILENLSKATRRVYTNAELSELLSKNRELWRVGNVSGPKFTAFLVEQDELQQVVLSSEKYRSATRFIRERASVYELALSLRTGAYLSHGTAVFFHRLNDQIPKTVYVNHEQSPKTTSKAPLTQQRIDFAFASKQRTSNYTYKYQDSLIVLLSGKNTDRLEVAKIPGPTGDSLDCTKLERTLIDIVVRPAYAGGIFQVLEAYKAARDRVSTNVLLATLKKLAYVYPYHQAIGFLMERANYAALPLSRLNDIGLQFDFYLVHGANRTNYDSKWRVHYPEGF